MKTLRVMVMVEVRVNDQDDEDEVREAAKESLQEAIDDDNLELSVEESEDDEF